MKWWGEQMLKSLFTSASGMLPKLRELEISANNLANINTHGFKKQSVFQRHLRNAVDASLAFLGAAESTERPDEIYTDFSQGTLEDTGNKLDFALVGRGFFVIRTDEGEYLTRNGHFMLDENGRLVDENGNPVLTSGGELYLQDSKFEIDEKGRIYVDEKFVAQLEVRDVLNPETLERFGENYFKPSPQTSMNVPEDYLIKQGVLETSNVDPLEEMVRMIELYRTFELAQRNIQTEDNNLNKLINQAGRPR
ncbi:MAG: flagellar basal-body rod protein FlgF [Methanobacteriota archaeon]|nr:MAG: flagellar basal-body rod protein FlgF [Euryarchaeota archaeon]